VFAGSAQQLPAELPNDSAAVDADSHVIQVICKATTIQSCGNWNGMAAALQVAAWMSDQQLLLVVAHTVTRGLQVSVLQWLQTWPSACTMPTMMSFSCLKCISHGFA